MFPKTKPQCSGSNGKWLLMSPKLFLYDLGEPDLGLIFATFPCRVFGS